MYYVGFSTATVVSSLILFQGFNTTDATNTLSLLSGFVVTFLGVHLLNLSRQSEPPLDGHTALEGGLMNPRLSLQGRASVDGWRDTRIGPAPLPRHGRRSSLYQNQSSTLFDAFEEQGVAGTENVGLKRLGEAEDEDEDLNASETTHLRKGGVPNGGRQGGSRSHSPSPSHPPLR